MNLDILIRMIFIAKAKICSDEKNEPMKLQAYY